MIKLAGIPLVGLLTGFLICNAGCTTVMVKRPEPFTQAWAKRVNNQPALNAYDRSGTSTHPYREPPPMTDEQQDGRSRPPGERFEVAYRLKWKQAP